MVKLAKAAKKQAKDVPLKKKAPPPPKEVEESSEEDSDDEEEAPPPKATAKKNKAPAKAVKNGKALAKQESDDDDDDESEEEAPPVKTGKTASAKAVPAKKAAAESDDDDDDEDDDDEEESEEEPPKKATPAKSVKATPKATPAKEESDDDDEEEESEEEPPKKVTPAKATPAKTKAAPAKKEESDDEDDDDDDDSEEEMDTTPAPAKKSAVKGKQESDDDDDDDDEEEEDDDDDEEEDDDEEVATPLTAGKRKADVKDKGTPPAKKARVNRFSVFMGNLNAEKSFEELKEGISSFFLKEDLVTQDVRLGGSKKFGYVDFGTEEDLQKALVLNGKKCLGQPIKLERARNKGDPQESRRDRDARTLFVKNLPFSITSDELKEIFDQALDIRMPVGKTGTGRGIAYLEFENEAIAEKTLEETQGSDVQGRAIIVDFTGAKSKQVSASANKVLVVNNLAFSATEESLQSVFEKAVAIRIPQNNGRPKGYAFVEFENAYDSKEAMDSCNNTEIEGRTIRLEFSQNKEGGGRGGSGPTKTLFVKGLSDDTTDQTLRDAFEGAVAARIVTDKDTGYCKGFGFVDFDSEEDCKAAKEAMDDAEIDGNKVSLDYAKPKGEGGRGGFGGGFRGGFGGRGGGGRGGGFRGGRGGGGHRGGGRGGFRGGFRGGRGGRGGARPQGKRIKFDD